MRKMVEVRAALLLLSSVALVWGDKFIDLTYDLGEGSPTWGINKPFKITTAYRGVLEDYGIWVSSQNLEFNEHTSTHIDAPSHFVENGLDLDKIPFDHFIAPAVVINMTEKANRQENAELTPEDLLEWIKINGPIPDGAIIFVLTGRGQLYDDVDAYFGGNASDPSTYEFASLSPEVAKLITNEAELGSRVVAVGIDTPSIDVGNSTTFAVHIELLNNNIYGIENVANLHLLPPTGAEVVVLPMKIRKGTGGPTRIMARIPSPKPSALAFTSGSRGLSGSVISSLLCFLVLVWNISS